jgi:PKHD-type hydroxylase
MFGLQQTYGHYQRLNQRSARHMKPDIERGDTALTCKQAVAADDVVEDIEFNFLSPLVFPFFLTQAECESIVQGHEACAFSRGAMSLALEDVRECDVCWLTLNNSTSWLYDRIIQFVTNINRQTYNFKIDHQGDELQLTRYRQNDYIDWHPDCGIGGASTRKLAITIQLSSPEDYCGGQLEFVGNNLSQDASLQGSIIIFPAFLIHRVSPVTHGMRISLVTWLHGPKFV